ncbi:MAG: hypothetical protein ACRDY6_04035 [Acidimicrobiia bacterium]
MAWWPGDGTAEHIAGSNDGTLVNGATAVARAKVLTGFGLDAMDDRVDIPDSSSISVTGAITVDAWIKPDTIGSHD